MKKITLLLVVCLLTTLSYGQISATGNWTPIGNTALKLVSNDPTFTTNDDGAGDGALLVDGLTAVDGQGTLYTFGGTMENGVTYIVDTNVYNNTASYVKFIVSLYDLTANRQLATITTGTPVGTTNLTAGSVTVQTSNVNFSYTATSSEAGHILQLRYIRNDGGATGRDFNIDKATLTFNGTNATTLSLLSTTIWNGTTWSNGTPDSTKEVLFNGTYDIATDLYAKSITTQQPSGTTTVTVKSGNTVTLSGILSRIGGTFSIENNAKLIQTSDVTNIGEINVKRNSSNMVLYDYTLWSSPVTQSTGKYITTFAAGTVTTPTMRIYGYNTATNSFDNTGISATSQFVLGKGYAVRAPNTYTTTPTVFTGTFAGVPNNGPITIALDATSPGFNLVGNPYPSPISASTFVAANSTLIDGTLYFFSHNAKSDGTAYEASSGGTGMQYATWNGTGATAAASGVSGIGQNTSLPSGIIQTGQGFIVKATNAGNLSFTNAMRVGAATNTTTDPFFKMATTKSATASIATEKHRLWLNLTNANGEGLSQLLVGYVDGATNEADNLYDGEEFGNPKTSLTSLLNGKNYTIQGRALPFADTDTVPLAFKAATNGTYTIALNKTDGIFAADQEVLLKDNATGTLTNLKTGGYTFTATAGTANSRFELAYSKSAINAIGLEAPITAVKKQGVFQINTNGAILKDVAVYDMQGHEVLKQQNINSTTSSLTGLPSTRGVLIIKATTDANQTQTIKIIN